MSRPRNDWPKLAMQHSTATGAELLVLLSLAVHANNDGNAWPSTRTMAAMARMSQRSVQRSLRKLCDTEQIAITIPATPHQTARYCLTFIATKLCRDNATTGVAIKQKIPVHAQQSGSRHSYVTRRLEHGNGANGGTVKDPSDVERSPFLG